MVDPNNMIYKAVIKLMLTTLITILALGISFALTTFITYGVCSAFDLTFTWKLAGFIWLIIFLFNMVTK